MEFREFNLEQRCMELLLNPSYEQQQVIPHVYWCGKVDATEFDISKWLSHIINNIFNSIFNLA